MSKAERDFKSAVKFLVEHDHYPSPRKINELLGHSRKFRLLEGSGMIPDGWSDNINGRECSWRREACKELGFRLRGKNL